MSMFTRRNYIWLASVARDMVVTTKTTTDSLIAHEAVNCAIGTLADALESESPGFDKKHFLAAIHDSPVEQPKPEPEPLTAGSNL